MCKESAASKFRSQVFAEIPPKNTLWMKTWEDNWDSKQTYVHPMTYGK